MMRIVLEKHNYHGYVGIEYEGGKIGEMEGIRKSKALLDRIAKDLTTKAGYHRLHRSLSMPPDSGVTSHQQCIEPEDNHSDRHMTFSTAAASRQTAGGCGLLRRFLL